MTDNIKSKDIAPQRLSSSKIDKLLADLCPEGVKFKDLGAVCEIADNKRKPVKSGLRIPGSTPYYGANNIQDYVDGFTHDGDYILIAEDGSADLVNYSIQHVNGKFWANNHVHVIRGIDEVLNRFLFHWFRYMNFVPYLSGGTRAKLTKAKMLEIQIPIPPLAIQQEIVRILDTFTILEAELEVKLEAELEARKKQYEYYRDELLTFGDDVEWKTMGEVCEMKAGKSISATSISSLKVEDKIYPCIGGNGSRGYVNSFTHSGELPIIGRQGALCGNIYFAEGKFYATEHAVVVKPDEQFNTRFLYYMLIKMDLNQYATGGAQPGLAVSNLQRILIPIPPLVEQERIVAILDKFDALVNDISVGLPTELNARRKQYEHYRNKLLTFKKFPSSGGVAANG
jgi:type I restriction enzyme, S subunit